MSDDTDDRWWFDGRPTLAGALQRGLGRGALRAMTDPAAPDLIAHCLRRDHRWDWQVDDRAVYLARLVRDLEMPVEPIADRLFTVPAEQSDHDNEFENTLEVLEALGRAGAGDAVDGVHRYIRAGDRWLDVLEKVAGSWPSERWEDLYPSVAGRLASAADQAWWRSPPWTTWAARDAWIADRVAAACRPVSPRPFADQPTATLLARLRDPAHARDHDPVLRELRRRPPEPALLELVDDLLAGGPRAALSAVIRRLGPAALPAARDWAATPAHPLTWTALRILAAHGDDTDAAALIAGLDWLDGRPDDLCGYDVLVEGLARIGGPAAVDVLPRLGRLWFSPHSFERSDYLRAWVALDPAGASRCLVEGLWDCEAGVRLLAARHAPLTDTTRERLCHLRDDPIETTEVRAAALARLAGATATARP
ncbi:hypothetical protein [Polymorphospora lycopeni]|uniref:HEAT repeat domain-containing protein n=1 Tax=Polymorphospora lycopeni TaxID=3140240 RepID=A0ABV5CWG3_9ACTN